jgi:triphosphoribosyl-dephospho-CoA synthetase
MQPAIARSTSVFLPIEVKVSPETINVKCSANGNNGKVHFTIFGRSVFEPLIDRSSLALEDKKYRIHTRTAGKLWARAA